MVSVLQMVDTPPCQAPLCSSKRDLKQQKVPGSEQPWECVPCLQLKDRLEPAFSRIEHGFDADRANA